jgi:thiol-disulfide isomerase/thioredoxin
MVIQSKPRIVAVLVAAAALALVGVYGEAIFSRVPEPHERFLGQSAPDVSLQNLQGKEVPLRELTKPHTLVSLWATWCAPCLKELPLLEKRKETLAAQGVNILLVNYEGGVPETARAQATEWLEKNQISLGTHFDAREGLLQELGLAALPYSFLVMGDGKIAWQQMGIVNFDSLDAALKAGAHQ